MPFTMMEDACLEDDTTETLDQDPPSVSNDETIHQAEQSQEEDDEEENTSACRMS